MEIQLLLFLLIQSVICSQQVKTLHFDIIFENNERVKCTPRDQNEKLSFGDNFEIVAHLPYEANRTNDVAHMWCSDGEKNIPNACTTITHQGKSTCVMNSTYNFITNERWNCTYLMMKNSKTRKSNVLFHFDHYTQADCIFNVDTQGPLRFYVLDPDRLKITDKTLYHASYEYVYGDNEKLYVECIGPGKNQSTFLYKSKNMIKQQTVDRFSMLAAPKLDDATLTCSFKNERSSYEIKLTLIAGYMRFTGLNQTEHTSKQIFYKYRQNEEVKIGCNSNLPCKKDLRFYEAGTGPNVFQHEHDKFYYKFSGPGLNGRYLLCTCKYSDKYDPVEIKLTFEPETPITTTTTTTTVVTAPQTEPTTKTTTTTTVVTAPQTEPHAGFYISIEGPSVFLSDKEQNHYIYKYTSEDRITLQCTSKYYSSTKNSYLTINRKLQIANTEHPEQKKTNNVIFNFKTRQHQIKHTFKINGNGTIVCALIDHSDPNSPKPMTATVQYIFIPPTEKPTTTLETQPHQPLSNTEENTTPDHVQPAQGDTFEDKPEGNFLKEKFPVILGVGAAVVVICAGICAVMVFKKKSAAPQEDNYVNLENNQHAYNTLPVPKPRAIQQNSPTVEANYSEPKESNDMSDAMYADPNRFKETTYAEPYIQRNDMYAKPIPKSQRKPKMADDPNYSNMFGKDYVNSLRK